MIGIASTILAHRCNSRDYRTYWQGHGVIFIIPFRAQDYTRSRK
jgi:hypothetical protein